VISFTQRTVTADVFKFMSKDALGGFQWFGELHPIPIHDGYMSIKRGKCNFSFWITGVSPQVLPRNVVASYNNFPTNGEGQFLDCFHYWLCHVIAATRYSNNLPEPRRGEGEE